MTRGPSNEETLSLKHEASFSMKQECQGSLNANQYTDISSTNVFS